MLTTQNPGQNFRSCSLFVFVGVKKERIDYFENFVEALVPENFG
jgi:hypothetical protein